MNIKRKIDFVPVKNMEKVISLAIDEG